MTGNYDRDVQPVPLARGSALPYVIARGPDSKLRRAIANIGWPAYAVAAAARVHPRYLTEYMACRKRPPRDHLVRLCTVLGCEPEDLLEDEYGDARTV